MASFKLDPIFKGGISSGAARALLAFLEEKDAFDAYVIPSVGNYTAAQIIVQSGVDPDKVFCSDTNLYSAVLGHLFDPTLMIDDLGFKALDPVLVALLTKSPALEYGDQIIAAARILYALKWCQLSGTSAYTRGLRAEVEHGVETILNAYAHTLTTLVSLLGGLHYETRAPYDHIPDATGDQLSVLRPEIQYDYGLLMLHALMLPLILAPYPSASFYHLCQDNRRYNEARDSLFFSERIR